MNRPRFSIIVGVYNQAATLPALIESIKAQTFRDFEVHFCDDGSTDESRDIIMAFSREMIPQNISVSYWRQEHKGMRLARNLNQGIRQAHGEQCVFVMGDSMLETDYLEVLNEYAAEDRIVCGIRIQVTQIDGKMQGVDMDWRVKKNLIPEFPSVILSLPWHCLTGNGLTIPTSAMRLYGPWCEEIEGYGGEDNEIVARLFFKGYLCWSVPDLRLFHFWHKGNDGNPLNQQIVNKKIEQYAR